MRRSSVFVAALSLVLLGLPVAAQDPVTVDPKHYKVEFENDQSAGAANHLRASRKVCHALPSR